MEALTLEYMALADKLGVKVNEWNAWFKLGQVATARGDYIEARRYFEQCLQRAWGGYRTLPVLYSPILFAGLAVAQDQTAKAAEWIGLVQHHLDLSPADRAPIPTDPRLEIQKVLNSLQKQMAPQELKEALERGKQLKLEEVVPELLAKS